MRDGVRHEMLMELLVELLAANSLAMRVPQAYGRLYHVFNGQAPDDNDARMNMQRAAVEYTIAHDSVIQTNGVLVGGQ